VNKHVGAGHCEAFLSFSVISHRRLGGSPDLIRVPCVFGQRLNHYHPSEGFIVVFYFTLALVQALRVGGISAIRLSEAVGYMTARDFIEQEQTLELAWRTKACVGMTAVAATIARVDDLAWCWRLDGTRNAPPSPRQQRKGGAPPAHGFCRAWVLAMTKFLPRGAEQVSPATFCFVHSRTRG
jgi:hypothetical protein